MDTDGGAGHSGRDAQLGGGCDPTDHRPNERTLTLTIDPWVVVVRDEHRTKASLFRRSRHVYQRQRSMFLARQKAANFGHSRVRLSFGLIGLHSRLYVSNSSPTLDRFNPRREDRVC